MKLLLAVAVIGFAGCGCSHGPTRDPAVDAKGPVVNPLAPGAQSGGDKGAAVAGQLYTAPPGMKTGVPK